MECCIARPDPSCNDFALPLIQSTQLDSATESYASRQDVVLFANTDPYVSVFGGPQVVLWDHNPAGHRQSLHLRYIQKEPLWLPDQFLEKSRLYLTPVTPTDPQNGMAIQTVGTGIPLDPNAY